ncbi:MAG: SPOR domain-containing protein [Sinimarinibacterium sp.]|jgi:DedD protein
MDETLKRRLIGAGLLLLAAFLLASMLPEPRLRAARDPDQNVVTIELREPDVIAAPEVAALAVTPMPKPVTDPAPDTVRPADPGEMETAPEIESGDRSALTPPTPAATPRPAPLASPPAAQQAAAPTPAPTAAPTASPGQIALASPSASPLASAQTGTATRWWVQIGSYSDIANARIVETRMRAIGQSVVIAPIDTRNGVLYRVRCGPYATETAGQDVHTRVVAAGYPEARLINP